MAIIGEPAGRCGDLMEALEARHLTSRSRTQATGRATVYVQTSTAWCITGVDTRQRLTTHPRAGLGRSISQGTPASHPWAPDAVRLSH